MRILIVGAGAVGGYFGGRMLNAGRDVTFLVRANRALELAENGLIIQSPNGNLELPTPPTVLADTLDGHYDLILLSCKAYGLPAAIAALAPAVGPKTLIMPLLNGMRHLSVLDERFGAEKVLGGQCVVSSYLGERGAIVQFRKEHKITFGSRKEDDFERAREIATTIEGCGFDVLLSDDIYLDMWEKWTFLSTLAGSTCLMRAPIGDISATPGGLEFMLRLLDECTAIAQANHHKPRSQFLERSRNILKDPQSTLAASMMRDIESNSQIEADHIIGDLIRNAPPEVDVPLLGIVYTHLKAYEERRERARPPVAGS